MGRRNGVDQEAGLAYAAVHFTPGCLWIGLEAAEEERRCHETGVPEAPELAPAWPPGWLSLGDTVAMDHLVVDAAGGPVHCPIHYFDPMFEDRPLVPKLASMGELVALWIQALQDGTWTPDPEHPGALRGLRPQVLDERWGELAPLML